MPNIVPCCVVQFLVNEQSNLCLLPDSELGTFGVRHVMVFIISAWNRVPADVTGIQTGCSFRRDNNEERHTCCTWVYDVGDCSAVKPWMVVGSRTECKTWFDTVVQVQTVSDVFLKRTLVRSILVHSARQRSALYRFTYLQTGACVCAVFSETTRVDVGLVVELWNKGMLWDKLMGTHWLSLTTVKQSNMVPKHCLP